MAPAAELAEEHRELAEIAALEDEADRPDITELLPLESFHPFLELVPSEAAVLIAGEEDVAPALADHWQDVTAAFHDEDAHHLYVDPDVIGQALSQRARIRLSSIDQDQRLTFRAQTADIAARGLKEAEPELEKLTRSGYRTVVAFARRGEGERAAYNLGRLKVGWLDGRESQIQSPPTHQQLEFTQARLATGFIAPQFKLAVIPEHRLFRGAARPTGRTAHGAGACCGASPTCAPATSSCTRIMGLRASRGSRRRPSLRSRATTCIWSTPARIACSYRSTSSRRSAATSARAAPGWAGPNYPSSAERAGTRSRPGRAAPRRSLPASC